MSVIEFIIYGGTSFIAGYLLGTIAGKLLVRHYNENKEE